MIDKLNEILNTEFYFKDTFPDPNTIISKENRYIGFEDIDNNVLKININPKISVELIDKIYELEDKGIRLFFSMETNNPHELDEYLNENSTKKLDTYKVYKILVDTIEYYKMYLPPMYKNINRILKIGNRDKIIEDLL